MGVISPHFPYRLAYGSILLSPGPPESLRIGLAVHDDVSVVSI